MNFWSFFCGSIFCWNLNLLSKNNLQNLKKKNSYIWLVDCLIKRTCGIRVLFANLDGFTYEKQPAFYSRFCLQCMKWDH